LQGAFFILVKIKNLLSLFNLEKNLACGPTFVQKMRAFELD